MVKDLASLSDAIVWARRIVEVDDQAYVFRPLTLEERNMANYIHDQAIIKCKKNGMLTRDQLTKGIIKQGLWKHSYSNDVELLREELLKLKEKLKDAEKENKRRQKPSTKYKRLTSRIVYVAERIQEIDITFTQYIELPSVEYSAEYDRGIYSLHCATQSFPDMKQLWPEYNNLQEEKDTVKVGKLMRLFYDVQIAEESDIRELARSGMWRIKWMGSKKNRGVKTLFDREMYDLTLDQFRLVYWSQIYDSAFEAMEPPSDHVLENDELFDEWLEEQSEKRKQDRNSSDFDKKITSKRGKDGHELGITVNGYWCEECRCGVKTMKNRRGHLHARSCSYGVFIYYNKETIANKVEEVQSTNPKTVRQILGREQQILADAGGDLIEEQVLRDSLQTRAQLGLTTNIIGDQAQDRAKQGRAWK